MTGDPLSLAAGRRPLRVSTTSFRAGPATLRRLRGHVPGSDRPDRYEHDIIARALNDAFVERGHGHPVAHHFGPAGGAARQ